ncbi:phage holin family protein [Marinobacter sp. ATCH36]|uniref:phage holin family protein n=1 Tax=Marinobacter sp. ATCH36 TaxID=2945106 RepID=UPI0020204731|nr:phage holin family protein [Marinobacter sp. ATCH36]MCL7945383.1 phage holin family protein [Marinobacter sp. ATCH36]
MADAAQNGNLDSSRPNSASQAASQPEDKVRFYELFRHLIDDLALLLRKELALAGSEVSHTLTDTKKAISGLLSGVMVLNSGYLVLLAAATLGLGEWMELWMAALIVGGVVTVIGLIMVTTGKKKLESSSLKPERTMDSVKKDTESVKGKAL